MEELKKNKFLILFAIILIGVTIYLLYFSRKEEEYEFLNGDDITLKHYEENEYIPVNITYDQMARIYLQDYVYKLLYDREDAYNTLDTKYRNAKFPTFDEFNQYVDTIMSVKLREMKVEKFAITEKSDFKYYDVYDSAENIFIFKETGVMQYTVFFDRFTVEM